MNLREPKKKKGARIKPRPPFPILLGDGSEWATYTAHLTDVGSCIADPDEITAVHSMGFFGKGSLSRSYPSFGKSRYGAPPLVRNKQWVRREEWLKQLRELSMESKDSNLKNTESAEDINESNETDNSCNKVQEENASANIVGENGKPIEEKQKENTLDLIEVPGNPSPSNENQEKDILSEKMVEDVDVVLDSTEEDDICVILSKDSEKPPNTDLTNNSRESPKNNVEDFCIFNDYDFKKDNTSFLDNDLNVQDKLLVLPDSDSEDENYLKDIKPRIECASFPIQETLHLTFEETFFLMYGLGCLNLVNFDGSLLDINSAWLYFSKADKNFIQKYVVYHYFRSKGWVVKPGLKYGGDFSLYKQGPPFYHGSYIVIIEVLDADTLIRNPNKSMRNLTWNSLLGLERLSEATSKEILFAQVLWPSSIPHNASPSNPDVLSEFSVRELLWRRWNPKHNKEVIDLEEEGEASS